MLTNFDSNNALEVEKDIIVVDAENLNCDKDSKKDALKTFIIKVRYYSELKTIVKCVEELKNEDLISIYNEVCNKSLKAYSNLDISIILTCIKHLLAKCDDYHRLGKNEIQVVKDILEDVKTYLQENLNHILLMKEQTIRECEDTDPDRPIVQVCCPCRKLKTVFYHQIPANEDIVNLKCARMKDHSRSALFMSSRDVINWPNIAISIVFPNFQITHQNLQQSEYKLINFDEDYRPSVTSRCTKLKYKTLPGDQEIIKSRLICEYINQVKQCIRTTCNVRIGKKVDMLSILSEFKADVELCRSAITTNTEFYAPTSRFPYVRYLGQSLTADHDEPVVDYLHQIQIDKGKPNIRLQETARPVIMFSLSVFSVPYEKDEKNGYKFVMDEESLPSTKNDWLVYDCLVCDKKYSGISATEEIGRHLVYEHGMEPDWICSKCRLSFTTRKLACQRWHHDCKDGSKKFKKKKK